MAYISLACRTCKTRRKQIGMVLLKQGTSLQNEIVTLAAQKCVRVGDSLPPPPNQVATTSWSEDTNKKLLFISLNQCTHLKQHLHTYSDFTFVLIFK